MASTREGGTWLKGVGRSLFLKSNDLEFCLTWGPLLGATSTSLPFGLIGIVRRDDYNRAIPSLGACS